MIRRKTLGLLVCTLIVCENNLLALDCENAFTTSEMSQCAALAYKHSDDELNKVYRDVNATLNKDGQKLLKDSQIAWIKYRDTSAELFSLSSRDGTMYGMTLLAEKTALTKARVADLKKVKEDNQ